MSAQISILGAMDDPALFGGMFDAESWKPWRVFLRALYALPMDEADLSTYRHHTARQTPPGVPQRYAELVVGRRGGKSRILGLIAAYMASLISHDAYVVPGENPVIAIIAADRKQAQVIFRYVSGALRASPLLADLIEDELNETLKLSNGVMVEIHTGSVGAPRGRTFLAVLADECAFWSNGDSANPDVEIINAVRPGLASIPYSLLLIASSPYAKRGLLYQNYARYFGKEDAPVLVWQGSTMEMNAGLADDPLIAEMYAEDPERASAEFGAEFRSDIVAFITREAVEDVIAPGVRELPPSGGVTYIGHVDPSGGSADSMTLAIAHLSSDNIAVLDAIREVKPPFSPDAVVEEFAALLKTYGISRVTGDAYAGEWPRERFALKGIAYDVSKKNTSAIYGEFLPALNAKRVQLLDLPRLTGQLVGLERRTARAGRDSIAHAPGSHDDVANAACGALVQVLSDHRPALIKQSNLLQDGRAAETPRTLTLLFSVMVVSKSGLCGIAYFGISQFDNVEMHILDIDVLHLDHAVFAAVRERMQALSGEAKDVVHPELLFWTHNQFLHHATRESLSAITLPDYFLKHPEELALAVSSHVIAGKVKFSACAVAKADTMPLGGSLDLRAGSIDDEDPLRLALLLGIALHFEMESDWTEMAPASAY